MKRGVIFSLCIFILFSSSFMVQADPISDSDKNKAEDQLKQSEKALLDAEANLGNLEMNIEKLDSQIETLMRELEENKQAIIKSQADIDAAKIKVQKAEEDILAQQELFDSRMRAMYKNGSKGYLSIVLASESFTDLVAKLEAVSRMISFDKKVSEELMIKKEALVESHRVLAEENAKLLVLNSEKEKKLESLNTNRSNQQKLIDEAKKQKALLADKVKKDKESVNSAILSMDNDAIQLASDAAASSADISSAISYLQVRFKDTKSSKMQTAINKGQAILADRNKPKPSNNNNNNSNSNNNGSNSSSGTGSGNSPKPDGGDTGASVARYAYQFLGTPYLWGGTKPYKKGDPASGFDCSGLVQYCYKQFGISISRTTYTQVNEGKTVDKKDLKPGDLIFFGTWDDVHHVGMYVGNSCFIHAPRTGDVVKIEPLSVRSDYLTAKRII